MHSSVILFDSIQSLSMQLFSSGVVAAVADIWKLAAAHVRAAVTSDRCYNGCIFLKARCVVITPAPPSPCAHYLVRVVLHFPPPLESSEKGRYRSVMSPPQASPIQRASMEVR